jgi:hypothetical protein
LDVELIQNSEGLDRIRDAWNKLAQGHPFRQSDWLVSWWTQFQTSTLQPFVLVATDEQKRVRGIAPWYMDLKTQTVRSLGDTKPNAGPSGFLIGKGFNEGSVADCFAAHLLDNFKPKASWKAVHLSSVDLLDPMMSAFKRAMLDRGCRIHETDSACTWPIEINDGWDGFLQDLSLTSRTAFRETATRLDSVRVRWVHDPSDLDDFIPIFWELSQKGQLANGQSNSLTDQRWQTHLRDSCSKLLSSHQLQAFSLWMGQRPIAAHIGFRKSSQWLSYQTKIDPEMMEHEPGMLANVLMLRSAERFGIKTVEFLGDDAPFLKQLQNNSIPRRDVRISVPGWRGFAQKWNWMLRDR